jgi:tetratricopeptide (TPR) repeat protein
VLAHTNLGAALASQGKLPEAIAHYSEALRIDPNHVLAHYNLGITLAREGKNQDAIRHLEMALKLNPRFDQAHRALLDLAPHGGK